MSSKRFSENYKLTKTLFWGGDGGGNLKLEWNLGRRSQERLAKSYSTLIMALKTITVFCGSSLGNDPRFEEGAKGTIV